MAGKRDQNQRYEVHGDSIASLSRACAEIGMPEYRRSTAVEIVREVLAANGGVDFYWYVPPATDEVCCYWDDAEQNELWINPGEIHISSDEARTKRPERQLTYSKQDGAYVGWLLPGGQMGSGGGQERAKVATVLCPETYVHVPAGQPCSHCEVVHEPE